MSEAPLSIDPEALLRESTWLHGLARSLVHDEHEAEDVVQGTLLTAVTHPPRSAAALRAWLGQVARRLAIRTGQQKQWRARREEIAARPEQGAPTVDLVARTSLFRQLTGFVLELEEPYRTTVLLRYFEDVPVREIAARQQAPVATVKTRLRRALEQLRARLDRTTGGPDIWRAAFALPAGSVAAAGASAGAVTGAVVMGTKLKVTLATVLLLIAAVVGWRSLWPKDAEDRVNPPGQIRSPEDAGASGAGVAKETARIVPKPLGEVDAATSVPVADDRKTALVAGAAVSGRVLTAGSREPVAGADLFVFELKDRYGAPVYRNARPAGVSRPDGTFALSERVPPFSGTAQVLALHAHGLDWVSFGVLRGTEGVGGLEILARPGYALRVRVVEAGQPSAGTAVLVIPRFMPLTAWDLSSAWPDPPSVPPSDGPLGRLTARFLKTTDSEGVVRFEGLPEPVLDNLSASARIDVFAFKAGCSPARAVLDAPMSAGEVTLALEPRRPSVVTGTVLRADGAPVAGAAIVLLEATKAVTDDAGRYRLTSDAGPNAAATIVASATGFSEQHRGLEIEPGKEVRVDFKLLPAMAITGRVVDDGGRPVAGKVSLRGGVMQRPLAGEHDGEIQPDGSFAFHGADSSQWRLEVAPKDEWEPPAERVVRGGDHVEIVVTRAAPGRATVEAEIVDAATGARVDPTSATLTSASTFGRERLFPPQPELTSGFVRAERVPPGAWRLHVRSAAFGVHRREFTIGASDEIVRLRIELGRPAVLVARVALDDLPAALVPQRVAFSVLGWAGDPAGKWVRDPGKPVLERGPGIGEADASNSWTCRFELVPTDVPVRIGLLNPGLFDEKIVKLAPGEEKTVELRPVAEGKAKLVMSRVVPAALVVKDRGPGGEWVESLRVNEVKPRWSKEVRRRPGPYQWRVEIWPLDVPPRQRVPKIVEGEALIEAGKTTEVVIPVPE